MARDLLRFGLPLAGASALAFAVLNVDYVVVARTLGPVLLGYYMIAFNLSAFPVSTFSAVVRSVSLPGFGRLRQSPARAGEAFVFGARLLVTISLLASVLLAVLARPAIEVVYGPKWTAAAVPLVFLSGLGLVRVFHELAYDYLSAWGVTRVLFVVQHGLAGRAGGAAADRRPLRRALGRRSRPPGRGVPARGADVPRRAAPALGAAAATVPGAGPAGGGRGRRSGGRAAGDVSR